FEGVTVTRAPARRAIVESGFAEPRWSSDTAGGLVDPRRGLIRAVLMQDQPHRPSSFDLKGDLRVDSAKSELVLTDSGHFESWLPGSLNEQPRALATDRHDESWS